MTHGQLVTEERSVQCQGGQENCLHVASLDLSLTRKALILSECGPLEHSRMKRKISTID